MYQPLSFWASSFLVYSASSAYTSFRSMSFVTILLIISSTMAINRSGLAALPCLRPAFTSTPPDTRCGFISPSYRLHICVAITTSLGMALNVFSRPTNPNAISSRPSSFFSTGCLGTSVVPPHFLNPGCSSPISPSTGVLILPSRILSSNFNTCLRKRLIDIL